MTTQTKPTAGRPDAWCKRLRWKSYPLDKENQARLADALANGGAPYFCLATAHAVGPDDNLASSDRCDGTRACYEEHPIQIRRRERQRQSAIENV